MTGIRAVTFDAGGTLIEPWPSVGAVYSEVAREFGFPCEPEQLNSGFRAAWSSKSTFGYTRDEWFEVVRQSFIGTCEVNQSLFDAIYERFAERHAWLIYDDVIPTVQKLESSGIRLAVISNWDERLVPLLEKLGLKTYFEEVIVSSTVQAHKPDARIFRHALAALSMEPGEVLHVGDSETEDIAGARSVGLRALRIRRSGSSAPHELQALTEIVGRIGC